MPGDDGDPGQQDEEQRDMTHQGDTHRQRPLGGIDGADHNPYLGPQLAVGVGRPHVAVAYLPDVDAPKDAPGNIGGGQGAQQVSG